MIIGRQYVDGTFDDTKIHFHISGYDGGDNSGQTGNNITTFHEINVQPDGDDVDIVYQSMVDKWITKYNI
jgi:hypothetical protein